MLQSFFEEEEKEDDVIDTSALLRQQEQDLLLKQTVYFPQIIKLLEKFKETFAAEYFSKQPAEVKEAFSEQYELCVVKPVMALDLELFSDADMRSLSPTHRKKELYEGIRYIFRNASDMQINLGISK